nr:kelch repeat-containing protein [Aestuariibacter sp. A3R04]
MDSSSQVLKLEYPRYAAGVTADTQAIYAFGGSNENGLRDDIEIIDLATNNSQVLKGHILPRRYFSAVADGNNRIFLIGGVSRSGIRAKYENRVEIFNTETRVVSEAAPLPYPTRINTAVRLGDKIYVMGGSHWDWQTKALKRTNLMSVYDINADTWSFAPPMPTGKATSAVTYEGKIYVAGGYTGEEKLDVFEQFDPVTNSWTSLPAMPMKLSAHTTTVWRNYLLSFGDFDAQDIVWAYNFTTKQWREIELPVMGVRHSKAVSIGDTVYLVGGTQGTKGPVKDTIQVFTAKQLADALK